MTAQLPVLDVSTATDRELLAELARVEHSIATTTAFTCFVDADGACFVRVSADLLACASREHALTAELRNRRDYGLAAASGRDW